MRSTEIVKKEIGLHDDIKIIEEDDGDLTFQCDVEDMLFILDALRELVNICLDEADTIEKIEEVETLAVKMFEETEFVELFEEE